MLHKRITLLAALFLAVSLAFLTFDSRTSALETAVPANVTFSKDVAPIFFAKCAECHKPGEAAPFSALTFKDVRPWAKSIREKVVSREMPPWHANPAYGHFVNDRRLSQKEIDLITAWVDQGAKEGDVKDLPKAPQFVEGWSIGKPDQIFYAEEYTLEAKGADEYQYFDVPTNFTEDKYIQAVEARPGNRKVVHHIIAFIVPPGSPNMSQMTKEQRDKAMENQLKNSPFYRDGFLMRIKTDQPIFDDGCQPDNMRRSGGNDNLLTGYAPGHNADVFKPGLGRRVPAGSTIRFQIHYSKVAGEVIKDKSSVGVIFAKQVPERIVGTRSVGNIMFKIPAGAADHKVTACSILRRDTRIYGLMPHMHLRGKAMKYEVFYPDGKSEVLIDVPNYSFSWQTNYLLTEPKLLPKGTRIQVTGVFDNSTKNKYNPDPTKDVRYGEPTYDEMMLGFMDYVIEYPTVAKLDSKVLDSLVGKYDAGMGLTMTVTREGDRLFGQLPNQPKLELLPTSETTFFVKMPDIDVTFVKAGSEVNEVVLDLGNRTIKGKKIKDVATSGN